MRKLSLLSLLLPVLERPFSEKDVREADECFLCNTTSEVIPVTHVNDWPVGDGRPGPITRRLQRAYRECTAVRRWNVQR